MNGVNMRNDNGFTLMEILWGFSLFIIIAFTFPQMIKIIGYAQNNEGLSQYEVEVFGQQMQREFRKAVGLKLDRGCLLLFMQDGSTVRIEQYQSVIRRRVNNQGHEVLLQHVRAVSFTIKSNITTMNIETVNGDLFRKSFSLLPIRRVG